MMWCWLVQARQVLVLALLLLLSRQVCLYASQPPVIVFGIVPQHASVELARQWGPFLTYLEGKTGLSLVFETATDIPTFEERLDAGRYDVVYCNPADYVQRSSVPGYRAFAREAGVRLQGLVVVPRDSPVTRLDELAGATLAFPAPLAFAATLLPLAHFKTQGLAVTPSYVATHDSVYMAVARGYFPAGGGIRRTFDNSPPDIRQTLRIIWESPPYTPHPLAAHPRVPAEAVARLRAALVAMGNDAAGQEILARMHFSGFEAGVDADWDDVRQLFGLPPAGSRQTGLP
ncbi:phosphate/phosphite/phosphonate ABC transporter substrate-binding protein [Desulfovibrio sp. TomC]|uniref:phosphate/phosphite/phosphonate ABC transporter substrate-binding protein n=1 Tax=Desulfovibrio sp. TomC TaxID=1562888 RepID=UPI00069DB6CC|nr:phosphate/phosphite/phosphonate ABC transporter substrate-binding protein [Desulfovibrio sp. TomC]